MILEKLVLVLSYPINPKQRIFFLYLFTSLIFAAIVYAFSPSCKKDRQEKRNLLVGFLAFVFPKKVWGDPSAWVDVRYIIPHHLFLAFFLGGFLVESMMFARDGSVAIFQMISGQESILVLPPDNITLVLTWAVVSLFVGDFVAFYIHYLQHKIPLLWEFHKIHHSSVVLHPLSNYREHPVDNALYYLGQGLTIGIALGVFQFFAGSQPLGLIMPFVGINMFGFIFNFFGYNLRHSHIWLRWPGFLGYLVGCPAHHQIHHSCKPEHIDKNFAFMLPVWDLLWGTYVLPEHEIELEIGLGDGTERQYNGYLSMYSLPFINLFKRFTSKAEISEEE